MPYENLTELPDSVRNNLPKHAQEIYRGRTSPPRSSTARKVAPIGWPGARLSRWRSRNSDRLARRAEAPVGL